MRKSIFIIIALIAMMPAAARGDRIVRGPTTVTVDLSGHINIADASLGVWLTAVSGAGFTVTVDEDGSVTFSRKPNGPANFEANVHWGQNALLCRLAPLADASVAQFSSGPAANLAVDSLFDLQSDMAVSIEGAAGSWNPMGAGKYRLRVDLRDKPSFTLHLHGDYYKKTHGIKYYQPLDHSVFRTPISGWSSWFYYEYGFGEDDLIEITDWIAANLKQYGCEYVQIDSCFLGWNEPWTAWTYRGQWPHGGKWTADYIHSKGLKAGLWLTPYSTRESTLAKEHPEWFIYRDGKMVPTFVGDYTIDCTNPDVIDGWLKPLYRTLALDWGYDFFKHDGQPDVIYQYRRCDFFKKGTNPEDAYRRGQQAIREVVGKNRFILSCWGITPEGIGIIDGTRTGDDTSTSWDGIRKIHDSTRNWVFLNNIVTYTDPDVVLTKDPLTLDQARYWASLISLTGQVTLAAGELHTMPQERIEILRRVFPVCSIFPSDLYKLTDDQMSTIDVKFARPFGSWDVVGIFNRSAEQKLRRVPLAVLGLPRGTYTVYDFWNKRFLGRMSESIDLALAPTSCRVLAVHPARDVPQIVSTSRHITQGGVDLLDAKWNSRKCTLSGASSVVGNDPYELRIALPIGATTYAPLACKADNAAAALSRSGGVLILTLKTPSSRTVHWSVSFNKSLLKRQ